MQNKWLFSNNGYSLSLYEKNQREDVQRVEEVSPLDN